MATITQPRAARLTGPAFFSRIRTSFFGAALNRRFVFSLLVFVFIAALGFLGPVILGRDDPLITVGGLYDPPSSTAWLGTDNFGRDVFTQLMYGTQSSLIVGIIAGAIATLIGLIIGTTAGYVGGVVEEVLMA